MATRLTIPAKSPWFAARRPYSQARFRLFCFPYAGGSDAAYRTWQQNLGATIEVLPVQLPGRSVRMKEPAFNQLPPLLPLLSQALEPVMDAPFAFFGHSMGGLISFELARRLRREGRTLPVHLFISAKCSPPGRDDMPQGKLSDAELIEVLRRFEGTPREALAHAELMQLLLPIIRADMELCSSYAYVPEPPLPCPITAFGGLDDRISRHPCMEGWRQHTSGAFTLTMFPAGHFFLQTFEKPILEAVSKDLAAYGDGAGCG